MSVLLRDISISKNPLSTGEQFKISLRALDITEEAVAYRLSFKLGDPHGHPVGQIGPKPVARITKLPFLLGRFKEEKSDG